MSVVVLGRDAIQRHLAFEDCIPLMRDAMIALSAGSAIQVPRQIVRLASGRMLGVMPGAMGGDAEFGVKVVSVFPGNFESGLPSHQGAVLLFRPEDGALVAVVHAGEVTRIRTAAASAAATDALARPDASRLAVLGYGEQAAAHVEAISKVRRIEHVAVWGRDAERRTAFAARMRASGRECDDAPDVASAVAEADIICTTTGASEPILFGAQVREGAHVNIVGSSFAGPAEVDVELVARARYFADHREHVLAQGEEFRRARATGRIGDDHILGEIGDVYAGLVEGRRSSLDVTAYKSLGHVVQDLVSAWHVFGQARSEDAVAF